MVHAVQNSSAIQESSQKRRKSSGPIFSLPALPCSDASAASTSVGFSPTTTIGASAGKFGEASAASAAPVSGLASLAASQLGRFVGRSAGSGQCVALAKAVQPAIGPTSTWRGGDAVQGNTALQPGTVIATFNRANRYANALDGSSHAAIYLGQTQQGVQVLDQWAGSRAAVRTIPWNNPSGVPANTGAAFQVVKTG